MPVCSIDAPAVSGGVLVLWPGVWNRDARIQSYRGLWSYVCCSVTNDSLWWRCCIIIASQLFMRDPLAHGFMSCSVSLAGPYLCLLCKICVAYAHCRLFVLMYLICSLYLVFIPLPVCPTFTLLHVLHFISYMPLRFICSYFLLFIFFIILFLDLKGIPIVEFLNRFVIFLTAGL